jgi:YVTN family beta-propeller protein
MIALDGPGEDWSLSSDGKRLYVSIPTVNEIVAVDTAAWKIVGKVASISHAAVTALQPDEGYLWTAFGQEEDSGVIAIDPHSLKVVSRLHTGRGYHHLAFSGDSSYLYVTNPSDGTVSVIDTRTLAKVADVPVGVKPSWIAYSDLAKAAYVANEGDGKVVVIDGAERKVRATIQAAAGLGQIRFAPGGRYALTVDPANNFVYIVDAASNRIVQQGKLDAGPDQLAFTHNQAHIRQRGSDSVLMIALASLGGSDQEISIADFSGGRNPPGETSLPSPADSIVQASGENGVLVANPKDKSIYYYMEGSAAPMGNLSTYGHEPRAILAVDRNLRERSPGLYETTTTLPPQGDYTFALFLDQPRVVSCFDLAISADPSVAHPVVPKLKVVSHIQPAIVAGQPARLEFRLMAADTGLPESTAADVMILMVGPSWQRRAVATANGDGGYSVDFVVPIAGTYNVLLAAPSLGLTYTQCATVEVKRGSN